MPSFTIPAWPPASARPPPGTGTSSSYPQCPDENLVKTVWRLCGEALAPQKQPGIRRPNIWTTRDRPNVCPLGAGNDKAHRSYTL